MSQLRTLVIGLGETGRAAVRWCLGLGDAVRVCDSRNQVPTLELDEAYTTRLEVCVGSAFLDAKGDFSVTLLDGIDRVIVSPGMSPDATPLQPLLSQARERGMALLTDIDLFALALVDLAQTQSYETKVLAVTGTNGKTTVTSLTAHLLEEAGLSVCKAGNISPSVLDALMSKLSTQTLPDVWVLELSSFQLALSNRLECDAAVVLNVTQDHLDWHGSFDNYLAAKAKVLAFSKLAIVNRDDSYCAAMTASLDSPTVRSFGSAAPTYAGDLGVEFDGTMSWMVENQQEDSSWSSVKSKRSPSLFRESGKNNRLMPTQALHIKGQHNVLNVLAALALTRALGLGFAPLLRGLRTYHGEAHRVELVRVIQGVSYIDDSKGTNVGATQAALSGLGCPVVLIAGGVPKGQDFSPLKKAVQDYARAVLLIGDAAPLIADQLEGVSAPIHKVDSLEQAVVMAARIAREGDAVLLSPACASFDMFKDYAHRAQVFVEAVENLALDKGELV